MPSMLKTALAVSLACVAGSASAATIQFSAAEAPGVSCCGLVDPDAFAHLGVKVDNAYWYRDYRDTFDLPSPAAEGEGLALFNAGKATLTLLSAVSQISFQYFVITGHSGTYTALGNASQVVDSFTIGAPGADALGTHTFFGDIKYLTFAGDPGYVTVSGITTTSVPEPESLALVLAGAGVVSAALSRRARRRA
ncbi:MAG: PEP-CTERM sorting domain-containing protein [Aquabacterium sp.]|nr:PEP-CTERM sorting domain-containing protein [Aquabacterium sp.]